MRKREVSVGPTSCSQCSTPYSGGPVRVADDSELRADARLVQRNAATPAKNTAATATQAPVPVHTAARTDAPKMTMIWDSKHAALTAMDWAYHPHVLAFGLGTSHTSTICRVATLAAFRVTPSRERRRCAPRVRHVRPQVLRTKAPYLDTPEFAREVFGVIDQL